MEIEAKIGNRNMYLFVSEKLGNMIVRTRRYRLLTIPSQCSLQVWLAAPQNPKKLGFFFIFIPKYARLNYARKK